jgi:hypothetical protein
MLGVVKSVEVVSLDVDSGLTLLGTNLTKGQDVANCVPFLTQQNVGATYQPDRWMMDVYFSDSPARVTVERTNTGSRIICQVVVVEFDPNKVRVQQKSFNIPTGGIPQTVLVSLDYSIDASRAAIIGHYRMSSGTSTQAKYWALSTHFNGTTQARFARADGTGTTLAGHYYVFESLDSAFTIQAFTLAMTGSDLYDDQTISIVNMDKSWITPCSLYSNRNHAEIASNFLRVKFKNSSAVECDRQSTSSSYVEARGFVVEHHDETHVDHGQFDFGSSDPTDRDHQDALPDAIDTDYSAPLATFRDGMVRPDTYMGTEYYAAFARIWYSPNTSTIRGYRQNGSYAVDLRWQSVEFAPAPGYYVGGYVTEEGSAVERTVRSYRRDTGAFLNETTSSGVGGHFYLETSYSGAQYVVCVDDGAGLDYNALIYDSIMPTTISGG